MPKYYCDYCDTYLTHDSPSVRKTHCTGRKHKENVRDYYQKWMEEKAQRLIDQTTAAFKSGKIQPGMYPPIRPGFPIPPGFPMPPGMPGMPPPILPPGIPPPPSMLAGMPPPPRMMIPPPLLPPGTTAPGAGTPGTPGAPPPMMNPLMNPFIRPPPGMPPLPPGMPLPGIPSLMSQGGNPQSTGSSESGNQGSGSNIPSLMSI